MIKMECDKDAQTLDVEMHGNPVTLSSEMGSMIRSFVCFICKNCVVDNDNMKAIAEQLAQAFAKECLCGYRDALNDDIR